MYYGALYITLVTSFEPFWSSKCPQSRSHGSHFTIYYAFSLYKIYAMPFYGMWYYITTAFMLYSIMSFSFISGRLHYRMPFLSLFMVCDIALWHLSWYTPLCHVRPYLGDSVILNHTNLKRSLPRWLILVNTSCVWYDYFQYVISFQHADWNKYHSKSWINLQW